VLHSPAKTGELAAAGSINCLTALVALGFPGPIANWSLEIAAILTAFAMSDGLGMIVTKRFIVQLIIWAEMRLGKNRMHSIKLSMAFAIPSFMALLQEVAFKMDLMGVGGLFRALANFVLLDLPVNLLRKAALFFSVPLTLLLKWIFPPQIIPPIRRGPAITVIPFLSGIIQLLQYQLCYIAHWTMTENRPIGRTSWFNANQIASYNRVKTLELASREPMGLNVFVKEFIQENIVK